MDNVKISNKDAMVMSLVHYFITEKNYNPVIIHGINDEIWLENMKSDYKLIRIVSHYIHNNEQLNMDNIRTKQISKKLRKKTFSWNMNMLNIYVDLGDTVKLENNDSHFLKYFIKNLSDINKANLKEIFPDIIEKTRHDEKGMALLLKITEDINKNNIEKNQKIDRLFAKKIPYVTYIIITLCVIMFAITRGGYDIQTLLRYGANLDLLTKSGEYYRLFTSIFLHMGILHILCNMYALYIIGTQAEGFFGKWKYLLVYLISGICGGIMSLAFNPNTVSAGASGAIFGLFGALLYFANNYRGYIGSVIKSQIVPVIIFNLFLGFVITGVDIWAHIGGLIGGLITANMLGTKDEDIKLSGLPIFLIYVGFLIYLGFMR